GTPLGTVNCEGYSGTTAYNPRDQVMQDIMGFPPPFAPVKVGDGTGNVDWTTDPYHNASWTLWLLDLRWLGALIDAGTAGDRAALDHAVAVTQSYIAENPPSGWAGNESAEGRAHRSEVLICLALATGSPQWLVDALDTHAQYLE